MNAKRKNLLLAFFLAASFSGGPIHAASIEDASVLIESNDFEKAYGILMEKAESRDADNDEAMEMLGDMYAKGQGVVGDHREAIKWYTEAAQNGNADAQKKGNGIIELFEEAMRNFRNGNSLTYTQLFTYLVENFHHVEAMYMLGYVNAGALSGLKEDYEEAHKYLLMASTRGHPDAQAALAYIYAEGYIEPEDEKVIPRLLARSNTRSDLGRAVSAVYQFEGTYTDLVPNGYMQEWLELGTDMGMPLAFYHLAELKGVDSEQGIQLIQEASRLGVSRATYILAENALSEAGEMNDEVLSLYLKATNAGSPKAALKVGDHMLELGSSSEAFNYYQFAAKKGIPEAQHKLSQLLWEGRGTSRDREAAISWLKTATDSNYAPAFRGIANTLLALETPNVVSALHFLRLGATNGDSESALMLSKLHYDKQLFPRDAVRSFFWVNVASSLAPSDATQRLRDRIASQIPEDILLEAERASNQWIRSNVQ